MTTKDDKVWQDDAKCRGVDPAIFFPDPVTVYTPGKRARKEISDKEKAKEEVAKAVCRDCPVAEPCRAQADWEQIPDGVWGGESGDDRRKRWKREHRRLRAI